MKEDKLYQDPSIIMSETICRINRHLKRMYEESGAGLKEFHEYVEKNEITLWQALQIQKNRINVDLSKSRTNEEADGKLPARWRQNVYLWESLYYEAVKLFLQFRQIALVA